MGNPGTRQPGLPVTTATAPALYPAVRCDVVAVLASHRRVVSARRAATAARQFFQRAIRATMVMPAVLTTPYRGAEALDKLGVGPGSHDSFPFLR